MNCQEAEQTHLFICTTDPAAYNGKFFPMQEEDDYVQSQSNPNLWHVNINETFTIEGLDSWKHLIFKGSGYNRRRYIAKLVEIYNVESDGSLAYDCTDYIKRVEPADVPCNHIFGD